MFATHFRRVIAIEALTAGSPTWRERLLPDRLAFATRSKREIATEVMSADTPTKLVRFPPLVPLEELLSNASPFREATARTESPVDSATATLPPLLAHPAELEVPDLATSFRKKEPAIEVKAADFLTERTPLRALILVVKRLLASATPSRALGSVSEATAVVSATEMPPPAASLEFASPGKRVIVSAVPVADSPTSNSKHHDAKTLFRGCDINIVISRNSYS